MSDEKAAEAPEEKKKNPMIKIIILVVVFLVVISIAVVGTLFATGAFSKKPVDAEQSAEEEENADAEHGAPAEHGKPAAHGESGGHDKPKEKGEAEGHAKSEEHGGEEKKGASKAGEPHKKPIPEDAQARFEKSYMELDDKKSLVANVAGSRKVMQTSLSLMTQYDDRVFQNVEKHRAALRSVALDVLRQVTEADLAKPDFRADLAKQLRDKINAELVRLENFGGIEEVFFTEFVYQ